MYFSDVDAKPQLSPRRDERFILESLSDYGSGHSKLHVLLLYQFDEVSQPYNKNSHKSRRSFNTLVETLGRPVTAEQRNSATGLGHYPLAFIALWLLGHWGSVPEDLPNGHDSVRS